MDMMFKVYRSDRRKATIGDPWDCVESKGIKHHRGVIEAYIGSGRNAYVVFKATEDEPATAYHFMISVRASRIRDIFDQNKKLQSQELILKRPKESQTLTARAGMGKIYKAKIKDGSHVPVKRGSPRTTRMERHLPPAQRPRPNISSGGSVDTQEEAVV
jgi:hypothetical protein